MFKKFSYLATMAVLTSILMCSAGYGMLKEDGPQTITPLKQPFNCLKDETKAKILCCLSKHERKLASSVCKDWSSTIANIPFLYIPMGQTRFITNHHEIIGADIAHEKNIYGEGVKIAIIDGNWFDCLSDTKDALTQTTKDRLSHHLPSENEPGHSNLVSSIIAGKRGIAPKSQLEVFSQSDSSIHTKEDPDWDQKWENWCSTAINAAISTKVDFINLSIGWGGIIDQFPESIEKSLYLARDAGIGVLWAGSNSDFLHLGEDMYKNFDKIVENMKGYLRVVVSTKYEVCNNGGVKDYPFCFSLNGDSQSCSTIQNYGIAAPGSNILSCGTHYKEIVWSGTSPATAMITASAALVRSQSPHLSNADILDILAQSARKTELNPKVKEIYFTNNEISVACFLYKRSKKQKTFEEYLERCYQRHILLKPKYFGQGVVNIPAALALAAQYGLSSELRK